MQSASETPSSHSRRGHGEARQRAAGRAPWRWRVRGAGRTGAQRLSPSAVILGTWTSQNNGMVRPASSNLLEAGTLTVGSTTTVTPR